MSAATVLGPLETTIRPRTMAARRINAAIRRLNWNEVENSLRPPDGGEGIPFELCDATLDDWKRYMLSEFGALSASMVMWSRGRIITIEIPGTTHGGVVCRLSSSIMRSPGTGINHLRGHGEGQIRRFNALGDAELGALRPDASFGPSYRVADAIKPRGFNWSEFQSLKVEVGIHQQWGRSNDGRGMQYPGVQYILCAYLSEDLNVRQYRLDSVVNDEFAVPRMPITTIDEVSILTFDVRRLLGLPPGADLPVGFNDPVIVNLFDAIVNMILQSVRDFVLRRKLNKMDRKVTAMAMATTIAGMKDSQGDYDPETKMANSNGK